MPAKPSNRVVALYLVCLPLGAVPPARADIGGTVALQSDARDRGLSYSQDKPQARLTLSWDGASGWYAGSLLSRARFDMRHGSALLQAYAGRVFNVAPGLDAEAGLRYTGFPSIGRYDFGEAYAGLLGERWAARLHYANDYYGSGQRTVYGELDLNWPLRNTLWATAHAGALAGRSGAYENPHGDVRLDTRLGLAWQLQPVELQLSWSTVTPGGPYTWVNERHRQALVFGISASF